VRGVAVELDNEALLSPQEVDLEPATADLETRVDGRPPAAEAVHERENRSSSSLRVTVLPSAPSARIALIAALPLR
jgi:hypothetical protein